MPSRQELINLLDFAIYVRNISFFILALFYLRRSSVAIEFEEKDKKIVKITGPWREAILYTLNKAPNAHYDTIFEVGRLPLRTRRICMPRAAPLQCYQDTGPPCRSTVLCYQDTLCGAK